MNSEDSCHRFFGVERSLVRGYRLDPFASGIQGQQRVRCDRAIGSTRPKTYTYFPTRVVSHPKL
ncbi:hypothetical protein QUA27_25180 [Microcoleus sp. Pol14C6]|uniref:hypothetical protein n=1 Tax=unclassified Microcoleus TaxID=2642155 RepID=UPI002FD12228